MALFGGNEANIKAVITAEDKASPVLKGFSVKTVAIGSALGGALYSLANKGVSALSNSLSDAVKRVDTLNNAKRTFANMGFGVSQVKDSMDKLNQSILGLPTPLDQAVQGVTMIAAATNDVGKSQQVFSALNDAILGFGGTANDVQGAVLQLSQDLAGGRLQAQTWNSLLQNGLGPTLAAMARSMGITTKALKDGLSTGKISVKDFQDQLIKLDNNGGGGLKSLKQIAKDSTNGIQTSFANAKTAIVRAMANIIDSIGQARISEAINTVGTAIANLIIWFANLAKFIIDHKPLLFALAGAFTGIAIAIGVALAPAIWDAVVAFSALVVAAAPFIAVGAAIGLIAYEIIKHWQGVKNFFLGVWDWFKKTWPLLLAVLLGPFGLAVAIIIKNWGSILNFFKTLPGKIKGFVSSVGGFILAPFKWAFNEIAKLWNNTVAKVSFKAPSWVPKIGGKGWSIPKIPELAQGGIVTKPTLAVIGEAGPEAVVPLNKSNGLTQPNIIVNIGMYAGSEMEKRKIATSLMRAYNDAMAAKGMA